jgi:D-alanine transaminase
MTTCFLNGKYLDLEDAKISVLDRGFVFGDAVYEVLTSHGRKIFGLNEHLARLEQSLSEVSIRSPMSRDSWCAVLEKLIFLHANMDLSLYIQVSRGVAPRSHTFPKDIEPTVFIMCQVIEQVNDLSKVSCITLTDNRWGRCDIKTTSLLPNLLLKNTAINRGAHEAILIRDGYVTEGASSNVFIVKDEKIFTSPTSKHTILPGVTRKLICDVAHSIGIDYMERQVSQNELLSADEIWLTSSTSDIVAVSVLDKVPVGKDFTYPFGQRVYEAFNDYKRGNSLSF